MMENIEVDENVEEPKKHEFGYDPEDRSTWGDPEGPEPVVIQLEARIVAVGGASA